ncbi:bZIP transcription factor, bZIP-1 [Ascosphaera apis ARSEF 7405]|uniref:BZIP transcription factor, bZIP-1 n=1 Tax=Ascosphaera apis ARSEF 7405 TaxID=392613 RepID=A0A167YN75_9EURO|nr:bZIP transcription factor, bZIP-1 [Ascosphaera apis ARSEF 7405]
MSSKLKARNKMMVPPELEDLNQIHDPKERRKVQNRLSQRKHRKRQKEQLHSLQALVLSMDQVVPGFWTQQLGRPPPSRFPMPASESRSMPQSSASVLPSPLESESTAFTTPSLINRDVNPSLNSVSDMDNWLRDISIHSEAPSQLPYGHPPGNGYSPEPPEACHMDFRPTFEDFQPYSMEQSFSPEPVHDPMGSTSNSPIDSLSIPESDGIMLLFPQEKVLAVFAADTIAAMSTVAGQWTGDAPAPPKGSSPRRFIPII